jgi:hypothetical protein
MRLAEKNPASFTLRQRRCHGVIKAPGAARRLVDARRPRAADCDRGADRAPPGVGAERKPRGARAA